MTETRSTCPYCGVGCGVIIESRRRAASPACAATPTTRPTSAGCAPRARTLHLTAAPQTLAMRAAASRCCARTRRAPQAGALGRGARPRRRALRRTSSASTAPTRRLLRLGPAADRGLLRLQQAGQGPDRHQQHRHQLAPVHVQRGGRLQDDAGRRRPARPATTTSTTPHCCSSPAPTPPGRTRCCSAASRTRKTANPELKIIVVDPRRTDTAEAADLFLPILPGTDVALFNGMLHVMLWEGWIDAAYIAAHTEGFEALKAIGARLHARRGGADSAASPRTTLCRPRAGSARAAKADALAVLPGPEPVQQRHRQERRADQPAPGHRPDRQARRRPVLADRPAQRHGRARSGRPGQPAQRPPRPGQPGAPRRSGRAVGRAPTCRKSPARRRSRCSRPPPTARSRRCGSPAPTRRNRMPDQATVRRALERAEFVVVQEAFATTATCALRRPAAAGHHLGRKRRHGHQQRAPHQPRARRRAAPPARRAHDWADRRRLCAAARKPLLRRAGAAPRLFPYPTPESIWNEHRESTRGRDLDITGLSYAHARTRRRSNGRCPKARRRASARLYEDGVFPTADGRPALSTRAYQPVAEPRDARYPFCAHHRPPARPVARHEPHRHAGPPVRPRSRAGARTAPAGHGAAAAQGR